MKRLVRVASLLLVAALLATATLPSAAEAAAGDGWVESGGGNWQYLVGGVPVKGWYKAGSSWYLFNSGGNMLKGWQKNGGKWYYLKPSGAMATGWLEDGDNWYYLTGSGAMATGWQQLSGYWYYFYPSSGIMAANTTIDGYIINVAGFWNGDKPSTGGGQKENPAKGSYTPGSVYGVNLNQSELNQVKAKVKEIVASNIKEGMSEFEKASVLYDYLARNCTYAADWSKNRANTAWGALIYREAQCSGYARAYKALMDEAGIPCHYVHATNNDHQWNIIKLTGAWYIVDVTNGSANNTRAFFLVTDADYSKLGYTWDKAKLPACNMNHPYNNTSYFWSLLRAK